MDLFHNNQESSTCGALRGDYRRTMYPGRYQNAVVFKSGLSLSAVLLSIW
jgi:hypothetical protein